MDRVAVLQSHLPSEVMTLCSAPQGRRAVIVAGCRTPFIRAYTDLLEVDALGLGTAAVAGLLKATKLKGEDLDHIVWGNVIAQSSAPNLAKEIAIDLKLPHSVTGHTVSMACASGLNAILSAAQMIEGGTAGVVVAGGSDSMSCGQLPLDRHVTQSLALYGQGKLSLYQFISKAGMPWSWMPTKPSIAERSTGKTMGEHADIMCELLGATRKEQDDLAMASHKNASAAVAAGLLAGEVVPVGKVTKDNLIRGKQDPAKVYALPPVFRPAAKGGTVTAANASPVTDGGSAVLVMSYERAKALGYPTDIVIRCSAYTGIAPTPNLLLAPAIGIHIALQRGGLKLSDIDYFEIHEAFAGQVVATLKCLASAELSKKYLDGREALGQIPLNRVNIYGGSVAFGHPFAATGARIVTNAARILRTKKCRYVLISICAAGGLGAVTILERIEGQ
jgi:acetyl-CoA acyltransferase